MDPHKNFAVSAVAVAPSPSTSGTSLTVTTGQGSRFNPPGSIFRAYNLVVWPTGVLPTPANSEVVRLTAAPSGDVLTVARSQETAAGGPAARSIQVGDLIAAAETAKTYTDIEYDLLTNGVDIITPPGWRDGFDTAKALAGSQLLRVWIGLDSIGLGIGASDLTPANPMPPTSMAYRIHNDLVTLFGLGGVFFPPTSSLAKEPSFPGTPPWVINGASPIWAQLGAQYLPVWVAAAVAPAMTFTVPFNGTGTLWYRDHNAATPAGSWRKNAGAATNFNTTGAQFAKSLSLGSLVAGDTIRIDQATSLAVGIIGISIMAATTGVATAFVGSGGAMVSSMVDENYDFMAAKSNATTWGANGFPAQPHLFIISGGANDNSGYLFDCGPDQLRQSVYRIIDNFRRGQPGCSGIWTLANVPDPTISDMSATPLVTDERDWPMMKSVIKQMCWDQRVAVIDIDRIWGLTPRTQGLNTSTTDLHPNNTGYLSYRDAIRGILL